MDQLKSLAARLSTAQKLSLAAAVIAVLLGLSWGVKWNKERDLKPLFTGLSAEDAASVVEKLKTSNVEYKVAENGGVILAPSDRVAELRLEMAAAGLPKTGRLGFELFDKTNFGATEFAEQVNFRRALEGELERSVMSLAEVERARVHVTFPKHSVFLESREPAKASVMVKLKPGAQLSVQNVLAITHLTASAVEGLSPESVSVLDMNGNLLNKLRKPAGESGAPSDAMIEYRQAVEKDLLAKIHATLDPLLGEDRFRVGVSAECDFTSGEQSEELFDPGKSVMLTSQKSEDASGVGGASGVPGAASNLPRPTSRPGTSTSGVSRRTENIAFQTSRTVKHTKIPQGAVKRISISVLVDHNLRWEGTGQKAKRVLEAPSPEKLKVVKDVVAGIVGFQQDRGDQILVESLPFEATVNAAPPEGDSPLPAPKTAPGFQVPAWAKPLTDKVPMPVLLGVAGGILLAVLAGGFLFLKRRAKKRAAIKAGVSVPGQISTKGEPAQLAGENFEERALAQLEEAAAAGRQREDDILAELRGSSGSNKGEVLKKHLAAESKKNPEAVAQLVRTWLTEEPTRQ